jgi:hypothetical protein
MFLKSFVYIFKVCGLATSPGAIVNDFALYFPLFQIQNSHATPFPQKEYTATTEKSALTWLSGASLRPISMIH